MLNTKRMDYQIQLGLGPFLPMFGLRPLQLPWPSNHPDYILVSECICNSPVDNYIFQIQLFSLNSRQTAVHFVK